MYSKCNQSAMNQTINNNPIYIICYATISSHHCQRVSSFLRNPRQSCSQPRLTRSLLRKCPKTRRNPWLSERTSQRNGKLRNFATDGTEKKHWKCSLLPTPAFTGGTAV